MEEGELTERGMTKFVKGLSGQLEQLEKVLLLLVEVIVNVHKCTIAKLPAQLGPIVPNRNWGILGVATLGYKLVSLSNSNFLPGVIESRAHISLPTKV
ncbi:hypothetical protein JHK85_037492 [Glycine max]|nr:hypothetical protein JHK85_037492 [Glycine max]